VDGAHGKSEQVCPRSPRARRADAARAQPGAPVAVAGAGPGQCSPSRAGPFSTSGNTLNDHAVARPATRQLDEGIQYASAQILSRRSSHSSDTTRAPRPRTWGQWRQGRGMTQKRLARMLDVGPAALARSSEKNGSPRPSLLRSSREPAEHSRAGVSISRMTVRGRPSAIRFNTQSTISRSGRCQS
jgi:hypothetical protein